MLAKGGHHHLAAYVESVVPPGVSRAHAAGGRPAPDGKTHAAVTRACKRRDPSRDRSRARATLAVDACRQYERIRVDSAVRAPVEAAHLRHVRDDRHDAANELEARDVVAAQLLNDLRSRNSGHASVDGAGYPAAVSSGSGPEKRERRRRQPIFNERGPGWRALAWQRWSDPPAAVCT